MPSPLNFILLSFCVRRRMCCHHATSQLCITNFVDQSTSWESNDLWNLIAISLPFSYVICYICTPADMQKWHKSLHTIFCSKSILLHFPLPHTMTDQWPQWRQSTDTLLFCKRARVSRLSRCVVGRCASVVQLVGDTTLSSGRSGVRFPMVSLEIFIDIGLPVALCSWGRVSH